MYVVVNKAGVIVQVETRYRARGAARRLSVGSRAVVMHEGKLVACASNGRILPAKWIARWSGEARREWEAIAAGAGS